MALNLRKLRNLITFQREVPDYIPTPDTEVTLPMDENGFGGTISMPNRGEGPLRQVGSHRVTTPLGERLRAAIPEMISAGIVAGSHRNFAGGGPADIFGALSDVQHSRQQNAMVQNELRRQSVKDLYAGQ